MLTHSIHNVDAGGVTRHIARPRQQHPILSEPTTARSWLWVLRSLWGSSDRLEVTLIDSIVTGAGALGWYALRNLERNWESGCGFALRLVPLASAILCLWLVCTVGSCCVVGILGCADVGQAAAPCLSLLQLLFYVDWMHVYWEGEGVESAGHEPGRHPRLYELLPSALLHRYFTARDGVVMKKAEKHCGLDHIKDMMAAYADSYTKRLAGAFCVTYTEDGSPQVGVSNDAAAVASLSCGV